MTGANAETGRILLDGVDYRQRSLAWYQGQLGMVLQMPHIFAGTVADNIRYGRLEADHAALVAAARQAGALALIEALPRGFDTVVGEEGVRLSTGQKQLIAFARAILADPQIMVLDEATSSVDLATEAQIQRGLQAVLAGRMSFVIAHRLATVRHADVIVVVDKGVKERGSHAQLMARDSHYRALYSRQGLQDACRGGDWQRLGA
ncbi:MAG: ATP-binding cassette domain-containing protein [Candidatus Competibacterales bacterium]